MQKLIGKRGDERETNWFEETTSQTWFSLMNPSVFLLESGANSPQFLLVRPAIFSLPNRLWEFRSSKFMLAAGQRDLDTNTPMQKKQKDDET